MSQPSPSVNRRRFPRRSCFAAILLLALLVPVEGARGQDASLGGFIPFVGIAMTDESKTLDSLDLGGIPFIADASLAPAADVDLLGPGGNATPYFDLALLDTGAATHILTQEAFAGFDLAGNQLTGTNEQIVGGATGTLVTVINDAAGFYSAGLDVNSSDGTNYTLNRGDLRGQTSVATLTAPEEWELPNIVGLPIAAQHGIVIRNDQPQIFEHRGRTVRTPKVDYIDLGSGADLGITRRAPLKLNPGIGFIQGPQYVFNLSFDDILLGGGEIDIANNPASPSVILDSNGNGGGVFIEVDLQNGAHDLQDKELLFDTGADLTVVSEQMAKRLGFDAVLDTPDFVLEVEGSGGVQGGVPGFYLDELNLDTIGGGFTMQNVPIAVLDVTNPNDPGNIINGILGMHLFNGRNLVIDAEPSFGQGGNGPSLYISDPVTNVRAWRETGSSSWTAPGNWQEGAAPDELSDVKIAPDLTPPILPPLTNAEINNAVIAYRVTVSGEQGLSIKLSINDGASLTTFGETRIDAGGKIELRGGKLDVQFINIEGGELGGTGSIFVGTGPISSSVRNLSGKLTPGDGSDTLLQTGTLQIDGDYSSLQAASLEIDVTRAGTTLTSDSLEVSRFAFLAGALEVQFSEFQIGELLGLAAGDQFTILTADEGVFGEFDTLLLPHEYTWQVNYLPSSVVLEVTGLGLPGDFNGDGFVTAADFTTWRDGFGDLYTIADYQSWKAAMLGASASATQAAVPEPGAVGLLAIAAVLAAGRRRG